MSFLTADLFGIHAIYNVNDGLGTLFKGNSQALPLRVYTTQPSKEYKVGDPAGFS